MPLLTGFLRLAASGYLWLSAGILSILLTVADAAGLLDRRPLAARAAGFVLVLGCALGALSGTPLPLLLWPPLAGTAAFHSLRGFHHPRPRVRRTSAALFAGVAFLALVHELPFLIGPVSPPGVPHALVVLGDSLSAGGYGETRRWMQILAEDDGLEIRDLSRDGQTVARAVADAEVFFHSEDFAVPGVSSPEDGIAVIRATNRGAPRSMPDRRHLSADAPRDMAPWILIELGGNDVLGESTLGEYTAALDRLLALCRGETRALSRTGTRSGPSPGPHRTVVMLEIPGVPGRWGFATAQRRLAARHGVVLVPKRVLAGVVFARGSTSADALHLTQLGQQRLADALRPWLGLASR